MDSLDVDCVAIEHSDDVCRVTLDRADRGNALGPEMVASIDNALDTALAGGSRLLILEGRGRNFCTGFDLSDLEAMTDGTLLDRFVRVELLLQRLHSAPITTMAIAKGRTYGAGADLFVACDRRLAMPSAKFAFLGSSFGLILGTGRLADRVGPGRARNLLLDGREVPALHAAELGLVTALVEEDTLPSAIVEAASAARRLESSTVQALHRATSNDRGDTDLAALVRSAALRGLRDRIQSYRDRARKP